MDFSKLTSSILIKKPVVLTEAEDSGAYTIPDDVYDAEDTPADEPAAEPTDTADDTGEVVKISDTDDSEEPVKISDTEDGDETVEISDTEEIEPEEPIEEPQTEEEIIEEVKGIPEIKILTNLTDEEYNLNNSRCYDNFVKLQKMVENFINNNIMDMMSRNAYQQQAISVVYNNFSKMLDDIKNYLMYRFSSVYETNVVAYLTFMKRYRSGIKIIETILTENSKDK